jgi:hypothetical protein
MLKLLVTFLSIVMNTTAAHADAFQDCTQTGDAQQQVSGCTELLQRRQLSEKELAGVYYNRGVAYMRDRRTDLAERDFDESIAHNGNDWHAYYQLGILYDLQHKADAAAKDLERAAQIIEAVTKNQPDPKLENLAKSLRDSVEKYSYNKMEQRWVNYLKEIQAENDYQNWLSRPYDLYFSHRGFPTRYELINRILLWVFPLEFLDWSKGWLGLLMVGVATVAFLSFAAYFIWRFALARLRPPLIAIPVDEPHLDPIPLTAADLGRSEPDRSTPPRARAPEPAFAGVAGSDWSEPHPILDQLRIRALNQLFDYFGLSLIPAQAWTTLDRVADPVVAFRTLAAWVGCDPELVRRKDANQLARMETAIGLLVDLHSLRTYLSRTGVDRIRKALTSAKDAALAIYARMVETLAASQGCRTRAVGLYPCAAFERFADALDETCQDPLGSEPDEIEQASILADRFLRAMHLYSDSRVKLHKLDADLRGLWAASSASERDVAYRDGILITAGKLDKMLGDDRFLTVDQIELAGRDCTQLYKDLERIFFGYASGTARDADDPYIDEREAALRFFGFPAGSSPSREKIKKAYRTMWKRYDPYNPLNNATEERRLENERKLKEINIHYSVLLPKNVDI